MNSRQSSHLPSPDAGYWPQAQPFRAQLRHILDATQESWRFIALFGQLPMKTVHNLLFGDSGRTLNRINPIVAAKIYQLKVSSVLATRRIVDQPAKAGRYVLALRSIGLPMSEICKLCSVPAVQARAWVSGSGWVSVHQTLRLSAALLQLRPDLDLADLATARFDQDLINRDQSTLQPVA